MNKQTIIFLTLITLCLISLSYRATYSIFTSGAHNNGNSFTTSETFPSLSVSATPTVSPNTHVVINEFSSNGNNKNEWIELYNQSNMSVDVSGWFIGNGSLNDPLPSGSIISAHGYAVIIPTNSSVSGIPVSAAIFTLAQSQIGNGLTDSGDAIVLRDAGSTIIDQLSYGTTTTIFATPPLAPSSGQSLARNPDGIDSDAAADWIIDSTPTIGSPNI